MIKIIQFPKVFYVTLAAGSFLTTSACQVPVDAEHDVLDVAVVEPASDESLQLSSYLRAVVADVSGDDDVAATAYTDSSGDAPVSVAMRALEKHLLLGDFEAAISMAKQVEATGADTMMHALVLMAEALKKEDFKTAQKYLKKTQKHLPSLVQLSLVDAYMHIRQGSTIEEAMKATKNAEIRKGYEARIGYHKGRMALIKGDKKAAMQFLEDSQQVEEGALFTTRALARLYAEQGDTEKAFALYDAFRELHRSALLFADVSNADFLTHEMAIKDPLGTIATDAAESFFGLSILLWAQGAELPARQFMALALYLAPEEDFMPYYMGVLTESMGLIDVAEPYYERIKNTPGLRLASSSRLGAAYRADGRYEQAEEVLKKGLTLDEKNPVLKAQLAQVYEDKKAYKKAIELYDDMLAADPSEEDRARIFFARGAAWERLGQYERGTTDLQASLKIVPDQPMVLNYLGYMWVDANMRVDEGLNMLKKAHKLAPNSPAVLDSLGWAYYKVGKYPQALLFIQKAISMEGEDGVLHYHLGDVYHALGNDMMAYKHWLLADEYGVDTDIEKKALREKLEAR